MSYLCYTLAEAAAQLGFPEGVLRRLSQYFQIPRASYTGPVTEALSFNDEDVAFFRQVESLIVAGNSLLEIRDRLPKNLKPLSTLPSTNTGLPSLGGMPTLSAPTAARPEWSPQAPFRQAAAQSLHDYQATLTHAPGALKSLAQRLHTTTPQKPLIMPKTPPTKSTAEACPKAWPKTWRNVWDKYRDTAPVTPEAQALPTPPPWFQERLEKPSARPFQQAKPVSVSTPQATAPVRWDGFLKQQAANSPANPALAQTAAYIRERALMQALASSQA